MGLILYLEYPHTYVTVLEHTIVRKSQFHLISNFIERTEDLVGVESFRITPIQHCSLPKSQIRIESPAV